VTDSRSTRADIALPLTQFDARPGIIDLGFGHPAPALLPLDAMRDATAAAIRRHGPDALNYGAAAGAGPLIEWLAERLGVVDGRRPRPDEILVTGGASHALDQVATLLTRPGDVVLVESPTYHLAVRILRDHPLHLVGVPADDLGIIVDEVQAALDRVRSEDRRSVPGHAGARTPGESGRRRVLLYLVPTFNNPTGATLPVQRRRALAEVAARSDLLVVEDDVYRELSFDRPAPPSIWSMAEPGRVVRLGSFSKTLAPGLRLGWLTADAATVRRFADGGLLDSGGGMSHFVALAVAEVGASGEYARHVERLRAEYSRRAAALDAALADNLPAGSTRSRPEGGYFQWVTLPAPLDARALLDRAEAAGASYVPGTVFNVDRAAGNTASLRLAFSRYDPADLAAAARRLGHVAEEALATARRTRVADPPATG
jgi:2-aminoadipate transaminase